jgi:hypothetical protein
VKPILFMSGTVLTLGGALVGYTMFTYASKAADAVKTKNVGGQLVSVDSAYKQQLKSQVQLFGAGGVLAALLGFGMIVAAIKD